MILCARALLLDASAWIEGGGVLVERGAVRRVFSSRRAVLRARAQRPRERWLDFGDLVLSPGLVDAHAHLELSTLGGRVDGRAGFVSWIRTLVRTRGELGPRELEHAVRAGADALLASGTTSVGDIDATGAASRVAATARLRTVLYREVLDVWDAARTAPALARVRRALPARALVLEGLAPHAPYTTSSELLLGAAALAKERSLPLTIHWAESDDEERWLASGRGSFARILPRSPRRAGLRLLDDAGLLGARTSLVHGNHPRRGDPERLARAGVTLVHCPGTHAFFARSPFPLERYARAGVRLALGTDSCASNESLDMTREMALARRSFPRLAPAQVFEMATESAALALGLGGRIGHLRPGAAADAVAWRLDARTRRTALEELTSTRPRAERVVVAGRLLRARVRPG